MRCVWTAARISRFLRAARAAAGDEDARRPGVRQVEWGPPRGCRTGNAHATNGFEG